MIFIYPGPVKKKINQLKRILKDWQLAWLCDFQKSRTLDEIIADPIADSSKTGGSGLPFVYFVNESKESVSEVMTRVEQAGFDIRCFSVSTAENRKWKLADLMAEVSREALYFQKRDQLADMLSACDKDRFQNDTDYRKCYMLAYQLLQEDELSEKMLDAALMTIASFQ